jgi:hypothetical protein
MFRFTIRDVLWLTVVVALGMCWWRSSVLLEGDRAHARWERQELQMAFDRLDAEHQRLRRENWRLRHPGAEMPSGAPSGPTLLPLIYVPSTSASP